MVKSTKANILVSLDCEPGVVQYNINIPTAYLKQVKCKENTSLIKEKIVNTLQCFLQPGTFFDFQIFYLL